MGYQMTDTNGSDKLVYSKLQYKIFKYMVHRRFKYMMFYMLKLIRKTIDFVLYIY